jgi:hypothetical protein
MYIPRPLVLIGIILLLGSWFVLVDRDRQSTREKIFLILAIIAIFATYRVMVGVPVNAIFTPIIKFFLEAPAPEYP